MDLDQRKKRILQAIVEDYIRTAEPVSSKSIAENSQLGLSSATIRNEMSELEALGYLEKPHTSAGRIPSPLGYRIYVNELMLRHSITAYEAEIINRNLQKTLSALDKLLSDVGKLTSQITHYPSYALHMANTETTILRFDLIPVDVNTFIIVILLSNKSVKNKLVALPIIIEKEQLVRLSALFNASFTGISEDEITRELIIATERAVGDTLGLVAVIAGFAIQILSEAKTKQTYITGASNLFQHPEYRDVERARRVLEYLAEGSDIKGLPEPDAENGIKIMIGPENTADELRESSVVVASFDVGGGTRGLIGIVGPTRMDYSRASARLAYIANSINWTLSKGSARKIEKHHTKGDEINGKE